MLSIAVDDNQYLIYEGSSNFGRAVWPAPTLSIATVLTLPFDENAITAAGWISSAEFVFREDSFDPVTRIRRGRLYKTPGTRPQEWRVQPHPAYQEEQLARANGGFINKRLFGFDQWPALRELRRTAGTVLLALGSKEAYTLWRVVEIERIITGEDLLTLRARTNLGVLPELNVIAVPENGRTKVAETLNRVSEAAYRSGPEDLIEASRAAVQWCLAVFLADHEGNAKLLQKDIGELLPFLQEKLVLRSLAQIFARFHSRAKPNEQQRYATRQLLEGDAEFALAGIGLLLRELGWAV